MTDMNFGGDVPGAGRAGPGGEASPKDMAKAAIQTVKDEAATFADGAKDKAIERVEQGKQTASETMGDFANAIRKAGDELAQHDQSMAGQVVRKAADGLESLSRSVSNKRPEELLDAVRDFARANPAAFIAGTVLVGLAIGRFAKSSERHEGGQDLGGDERSRFAQDRGFDRTASAYPMPRDDGAERKGSGASEFVEPKPDGGF